MSIRWIPSGMMLFILVLLAAIPAQAQQILTYGTGTTGTISAEKPITFYSFQGQMNDAVTLQVIALSGGMQPAISLNDPTGAQLASSSNDAGNLLSNSARIQTTLPGNGTYTVIVSAANNTPGEYAIRLDGIATIQQPEVAPGSSSPAAIPPGNSAIRYTVPADPANLLLATVSTTAPETLFAVNVTNPAGQSLGLLNGNSNTPVVVALAAGSGAYTLDVTVNAGADGEMNLSVATAGETSNTEAPLPPTFTPVPTEETGDIDVPATETPVPPTTAPVVPSATPVPQATATQPMPTATSPVQQATATFTPSFTPTTQATQATATFTPTYTPTTPPAAQTAPEDARFNNPLQIPLDSTVSVLDFVSYPDGDREDRVRYEVTGMNNNSALSGGRARLVISVSCFGDNVEQIQFFTGGQTYTCGQTLVDKEVTANSDTGSIVITAVGGTGTYVQWVLTGTATRIN